MIKSFTPVVTTLLLLVGSFLLVAIPTWMAYVLLASVAVMFLLHLASKHSDVMLLAWHFCAEFVGFCLLVVLFVTTLVLMNGLLV